LASLTTAVKAVFSDELARHAMNEGEKAVQRYDLSLKSNDPQDQNVGTFAVHMNNKKRIIAACFNVMPTVLEGLVFPINLFEKLLTKLAG
jgi:hypothetical protein